MRTKSKYFRGLLFFLTVLCLTQSMPVHAAMNDYCVTPPFIVGGVKPNLLLMVDNSGSMFDLTYIDKGKFTGTCSGGGSCSNTVNCPSGQTCANKTYTREPFYCYDQTYNYNALYTGYFEDPEATDPAHPSWYIYYAYDFTNGYFYKVASLPTSSSCAKYIPGTLCIQGTNLNNTSTPKTITGFFAEGNYLNWLTASKFDIEKKILTGGKYDTSLNNMMLETRGCVGRRFLKEPITSQSYVEGGTNTPLGLTFALKGPDHPYSATLLSPGGQTYLEIYAGDYSQANCQQAVTDIVNQENKNTITNDIELCLNYDSKGQYCSLDMFTSCTSDTDCAGTAGSCGSIVNDGVCSAASNGICSTTTAGVCTTNNGTCTGAMICFGGNKDGNSCTGDNKCPQGGVCRKQCVGGGKAGSQCIVNADCNYGSCTVGKVGSTCSTNAVCDLKTCDAGLIGNACVVNSDCNSKACSAPFAKVGDACTVNTDCNSGSGTCTAGNVGAACSTNTDCAIGYKGVCQKPVTQQIKSTYGQSMHECYDYWNNGSLSGNNWLPMMTNPSGCNQMYKELFTCRGGSRDAKNCVVAADCPGGTCVNGPEAIRQGSPVLVCGLEYVGYCAGSTDNWQTTNWYAREYASYDLCVKAKFEAFCGAAQVPPVVDPSDDPSTTENFDNLPAIIGDMAVGAQLGNPVATLTVNNHTTRTPTGLLQEFEPLIHFGTMTFDFFGSQTECPANVPCSKICSTARSSCMVQSDCPLGDSCVAAANTDGSHIIPGGYIQGFCSTTTTTTCANDADCPSNESCVYSVGNHSSGLINSLDNIFASTWTPFSEAFYNAIGYYAQRTDKRLNATDFITHSENADYKDPVQYPCQKNNLLLVTDGMSTADLNADVTALASTYNDGDGLITTTPSTCPKYAGSVNLDDLAWLAKNRNIKNFSQAPSAASANSQTITSYMVFNGEPSTDAAECNPETLLEGTARNGCGIDSTCANACGADTNCLKACAPLNGCYQRAETPAALQEALKQAFQLIAGKAASGTAASVLASGEGSGANLVQAIFYPERSFGVTKINWTGSMKNLWYYIDPQFGGSSIREDSNHDNILNLTEDHIIQFFFDTSDNTTKARVYYDDNGDGVIDSEVLGSPVYFESVNSLWEAGSKLWQMAPGSRNIYTTTDGSTRLSLDATNATALRPYLQAADDSEATGIIRYTRGEDTPFSPAITGFAPTYRNRTVSISGTSHTWKLGDIVNSTPRILSWVPLNIYHKTYSDRSYQDFIGTAGYKARGTVFVGANDGMLHAFKLGLLKLYEERYKKAALTGTNLGNEQWAYIPKNVLPYLKYLADPSYCHLYSIDATPVILDASIGSCASGDYWECPKTASTWKTILVGGMRFGGACKNSTSACTSDMNGDGVINNADCVHTPVAGTGYSSYFALDITDPDNPQVLWELSSDTLGFSTTGPAIVRIAAKKADGVSPDNDKNGRWFVVFGSGPTGPIDAASHQFKGFSDQPLKLFVVDLKNGPTAGNYWSFTTGLTYAFAGSMNNAAIDFDQDNSASDGFYQDDAVYVGYTRAENIPPVATTKFNVGGVLRLLTRNSLYPDGGGDATQAWTYSTALSGIGPVTSAVAKIQNYSTHDVWLYCGTGRYYYKIGDNIDDGSNTRSLYGFKEPCYSSSGIDFDCTTTRTRFNLGSANSSASSDSDGWYIDLDGCTTSGGAVVACSDATAAFKPERSVTDPLGTSMGVVFFTTTKPSSNVCEFGGGSHLWAVKYDTGWTPSSSVLRGRAILQVSTGSIEEIDLKDALVQKDGRRTDLIQGIPSGSLPGFQVPPKPMNKILHIREE